MREYSLGCMLKGLLLNQQSIAFGKQLIKRQMLALTTYILKCLKVYPQFISSTSSGGFCKLSPISKHSVSQSVSVPRLEPQQIRTTPGLRTNSVCTVWTHTTLLIKFEILISYGTSLYGMFI